MIIKICNWNACKDRLNSYIIARLRNDIQKFNLTNVTIEEMPCMQMCEEWPIVRIDKEILKKANPIKASEMMFRRLSWNKPRKEKKKRGDYVEDDINFDENFVDKKHSSKVNVNSNNDEI
jgi:hypothetical protein